MRARLPLLKRSLNAVQLAVHPGQLIVIAFGDGLELRESPVLERIRAELRGLGAALFLCAEKRVFVFRPDDDLDSFGTRADLEPSALIDLRAACGQSPEPRSPRDLSLLIVEDDGRLVAEHTAETDDGLLVLADILTQAGHEAVSSRYSLTLSRREVVLASLVGACALLVEACHRPGQPHPVLDAAPPRGPETPLARKITLNVNGQPRELEIEPRVSLLDALRERLNLTGSKKGCDHGQCGACTVLVGGRRVNACLTLAIMVGDAPITTIEGLAEGDVLHPMQEAFVAEDALQCGYCTPGQIVSAVGLVREKRAHTDAEVREDMSGNICRFGAYTNIVAAIQRAREATGPG